jgi:rhomboid family GlyGly-CTERM serine protease
MSDGLPPTTLTHSQPARRQAAWLLGLLIGLLVLLWAGGDATRDALAYDYRGVLRGEYWRLLTGHFVHFSTSHLALNLAGLVLIAVLFPRHYTVSQWLVIALASALAIDVGLVWLEPQIEWYVGLSGVLHGLLAAGAVAWWRQEPKYLAAALTLIFLGKLSWEQSHGALPLSGDLTVVVDAHLDGALGGATVGVALWLSQRRSRGEPAPL